MNSRRNIAIAALALFGAGCATQRPVLYTGDHYNTVGKVAAESDIEECMRLARESKVAGNKGQQMAGSVGRAAVIGGATGAAAGAFSNSESAGSGAAAGAAGAATASLLTNLFRSNQLDPIERNYVEQCLRDKGYNVIGWR